MLSLFLPTDTDWMCDCLVWLDVRLPGLTGCATACASWVHCFHVSLIRVAGVALSTFRRWSILPDCEITFVWFGATCPVWLVCLVCLSVYVVCLSSMHVCLYIVNYFVQLLTCVEFFCLQILTGCATARPDWMCDCLVWLDVRLPVQDEYTCSMFLSSG